MSDQDDDVQKYALGAVAFVVALVLAGVIGLAASRVLHAPKAAGAAVASTATATAAAAAETSAAERIYFEVGQDSLPADAIDVLNRVAEATRSSGGTVLISGFHDASGDAAANADLAKRRAQRVQHALEANGVTADHLQLSKPALTTGDGDPKAARRVELRLQ
jgi:outer membrane protein OmpA-like peptidoglycan-associated protein